MPVLAYSLSLLLLPIIQTFSGQLKFLIFKNLNIIIFNISIFIKNCLDAGYVKRKDNVLILLAEQTMYHANELSLE